MRDFWIELMGPPGVAQGSKTPSNDGVAKMGSLTRPVA